LGNGKCCRCNAGAISFFVWDDGYGISVSKDHQTAKGSISEALKGFQKERETNGIEIYKVKAWDYAAMCEVFEVGIQRIRETHTPALFHVEEVTQPQGIQHPAVTNVIKLLND